MMTSHSENKWTERDWRSIRIGWEIHRAVVEEGRAEGVFAYLVNCSPDGRAWFEKYDRKTKEISRKFSPALMEKMKAHKKDLQVYAKYDRTFVSSPVDEKTFFRTPRRRF